MTKSVMRLAGPAFVVLTLTSAGALAAEDQSWLCKYIPSACGSEESPGGLPGHSAGSAAPSAPESTATRGLSTESAEPPPADSAATAPAPAPDATATEGEKQP